MSKEIIQIDRKEIFKRRDIRNGLYGMILMSPFVEPNTLENEIVSVAPVTFQPHDVSRLVDAMDTFQGNLPELLQKLASADMRFIEEAWYGMNTPWFTDAPIGRPIERSKIPLDPWLKRFCVGSLTATEIGLGFEAVQVSQTIPFGSYYRMADVVVRPNGKVDPAVWHTAQWTRGVSPFLPFTNPDRIDRYREYKLLLENLLRAFATTIGGIELDANGVDQRGGVISIRDGAIEERVFNFAELKIGRGPLPNWKNARVGANVETYESLLKKRVQSINLHAAPRIAAVTYAAHSLFDYVICDIESRGGDGMDMSIAKPFLWVLEQFWSIQATKFLGKYIRSAGGAIQG